MLCERCGKKEANYHYSETVNGTAREYHLCSACADALRSSGELKSFGGTESLFDGFFGGGSQSGLDAVFASLFAPTAGTRNGARQTEKTKCSLCGATFAELVKEGKAGCPKCYDVFAGELEESIRRIHGRTSHVGSEPAAYREKNEVKRKLTSLEAELKSAIAAENYEHAAELRDEIRSLREGEGGI